MLTNKEIEVLCYCRGCLNRKCGLDLERSDIKHLKMRAKEFLLREPWLSVRDVEE